MKNLLQDMKKAGGGVRWFPLVLLLLDLESAAEPRLFVEGREAMGTIFTIHLYASNPDEASTHFEAAFDEIERLEEALSNYRPSSELSRINRLAAQGYVTTDPEILRVLQESLDYSRRTDGAFDVTVGPLMRAWGFFRGTGRFPTSDDLVRARSAVGWQKVRLHPKNRTVHFTSPGVELDLGAIGKGYAVDCVVAVLREAGVKSALVDAGSSTLYAIGAPPDERGWKVQVPKAGDRSEPLSTVVLRNESLSSSGNYEKFFKQGDHIYPHIMDPRTGRPVEGVLQTTVIAKSGTATDALATSMFVMGPTAGQKVLEQVPHASGLWILGEPSSPRVVGWKWGGEPKEEEHR